MVTWHECANIKEIKTIKVPASKVVPFLGDHGIPGEIKYVTADGYPVIIDAAKVFSPIFGAYWLALNKAKMYSELISAFSTYIGLTQVDPDIIINILVDKNGKVYNIGHRVNWKPVKDAAWNIISDIIVKINEGFQHDKVIIGTDGTKFEFQFVNSNYVTVGNCHFCPCIVLSVGDKISYGHGAHESSTKFMAHAGIFPIVNKDLFSVDQEEVKKNFSNIIDTVKHLRSVEIDTIRDIRCFTKSVPAAQSALLPDWMTQNENAGSVMCFDIFADVVAFSLKYVNVSRYAMTSIGNFSTSFECPICSEGAHAK